MAGHDKQADAPSARLKRLAQRIDHLADEDEKSLRRTREVIALRRKAAAELYSVCSQFVNAVNRMLSKGELTLDPDSFDGAFREDATNMFQINIRGRILQVEFEATPELVSTEDFRVPYTLSGCVRAFNQALLEKDLIEEQLIFYTLEKAGNQWRFFDSRTYRSGPFDEDYLIGLLEQLV